MNIKMIKTKKLDCGTTIVMEHIPYVQSAALGIWVRAGSVDETEDLAGVSHYIDHMMFKGTENRTARDIAYDVEKIGGQFNAFTGKEATCYYIKTVADSLEAGAEILLDMVLNSVMDPVEMEKERNVIFEEMKMIQDTPDDDVHDMIAELVFKGHPLGQPIIGTVESLSGIDREKLTGYLQREYTRDSIVIALAGNFDEEKMCSIFEERMLKLQPSKPEKKVNAKPYEKGFRVKAKDIEQSHLCLAVPGIPYDHELYYALGLLNNVFGGSMSSRLFQNIREEKGLAYAVYSSTNSYSNHGFFNIYAGVSHDKVEDAIAGIREELEILKRDGITEEELAMAKEQMKSTYIFAQENVSTRMFSIGKNMTVMGMIQTPEEVIKGYNAVTMDDIARAAEIICDMDKYCAALVTNKEVDLKAIMEKKHEN